MSKKVFVSRDKGGAITGIYENAQPGYAEESLPDDSPTVASYFEAAKQRVGPVASLLPQELMAQFTPDDMVKIMDAVSRDTTGRMALLWYSMVAQRDPMDLKAARVKSGWAALIKVLDQPRVDEIAAGLGIKINL